MTTRYEHRSWRDSIGSMLIKAKRTIDSIRPVDKIDDKPCDSLTLTRRRIHSSELHRPPSSSSLRRTFLPRSGSVLGSISRKLHMEPVSIDHGPDTADVQSISSHSSIETEKSETISIERVKTPPILQLEVEDDFADAFDDFRPEPPREETPQTADARVDMPTFVPLRVSDDHWKLRKGRRASSFSHDLGGKQNLQVPFEIYHDDSTGLNHFDDLAARNGEGDSRDKHKGKGLSDDDEKENRDE